MTKPKSFYRFTAGHKWHRIGSIRCLPWNGRFRHSPEEQYFLESLRTLMVVSACFAKGFSLQPDSDNNAVWHWQRTHFYDAQWTLPEQTVTRAAKAPTILFVNGLCLCVSVTNNMHQGNYRELLANEVVINFNCHSKIHGTYWRMNSVHLEFQNSLACAELVRGSGTADDISACYLYVSCACVLVACATLFQLIGVW